MVKPQPGSSLLFHDEQPKARRFSLISPSPFGQGPSAPSSGLPVLVDDLRLVALGEHQPRRLGAARSSASPRSSSARTSSAVTVKPACVFQTVKPQPGSFLLL